MPNELELLKRELAQSREIIHAKDKEISNLNVRIQDVHGKLEILQRQRPKLSPQNLIVSFGNALAKMQEGLDTGQGRVNYIVNNLEIELKTAITLDDEGNINFQLPKVEDVIPLENLSKMNLSVTTAPKPAVPPVDTREIPGVIGLPREQAVELLKHGGFKIGVVTEKLSNTPAGTVIAQEPERYMRSAVGIAVDLVVSKARETKIPNLLGISKEDAIESLEANRLLSGEISEKVDATTPGTVIRQSIQPETIVAVDTTVDLVLARSEMVKVPSVVGKSLSEAQRLLSTEKLEIGRVSKEIGTGPRDRVLRQKPSANQGVSVGSQIDLVVSEFPHVRVPDLKDKNREEAEQILKESSLNLGKVVRRRSKKPEGTVIGQSLPPSDKVEAGTLVNLTVALPGRISKASQKTKSSE